MVSKEMANATHLGLFRRTNMVCLLVLIGHGRWRRSQIRMAHLLRAAVSRMLESDRVTDLATVRVDG